MPPRRSATAEAVTEPGPESEPETVNKETVIGWVKEIVAELGLSKGPDAEPVEGTNEVEEVEEIETPRVQEARMRREVEQALPALHIHMDRETPREESKKEPEQSPAKTSRLAKFVGLS